MDSSLDFLDIVFTKDEAVIAANKAELARIAEAAAKLADIKAARRAAAGPRSAYWRVLWSDAEGQHFSDPLPTWADAEVYRLKVGGNAEVLGR